MIPVLTPAESADLDRACSQRGIAVLDLMEAAGHAAAAAATRLAGGGYGRRAVVVCGKGNNGGDGLVAARLLERRGLSVSVLLVAPPGARSGAAGVNLGRFEAGGGRVGPATAAALGRELARADVAVDAIFGTGFRGTPEGAALEAIRALNRFAARGGGTVAVDVPSGVEGETGAVRGEAVRASVTVTLGTLKPGLLARPGAGFAGGVEVADIGIPPDLVGGDLWVAEAADVAALLPTRDAGANKRSTGVVLVLAGSRGMTGAAILAATAASRAGAGLVVVAAPAGIVPILQGCLREAVFAPLPETSEGAVAPDAWPMLAERLGGVHAAAVGPGLTTNEATASLVRRLAADCVVPFVLDADGLNAFAGRVGELGARRSPAVLTPHAGEFARLAGVTAAEVEADRFAHTRRLAAELGCTVLLKGPATVVAGPSGRAVVNPTGGAALATAGTGDVLTGVIAALLARGLPPEDAATAGAFLHGVAGDLAAEVSGEGTTAGDVAARIPAAAAVVRAAAAGRMGAAAAGRVGTGA